MRFHFILQVKVLYSERPIAEGEEICIAYVSYNDIGSKISPIESRLSLQTKWGITCPEDCPCRDPERRKIIRQSRELDSIIYQMGSTMNPEGALRAVKKLVKNLESNFHILMNLQRAYHDGFQIAIMKRKTISLGKEYAKKSYDIISSLQHPLSRDVLDGKRWMENPEMHRNYLQLEGW
jgi:hypothetical protein